MANHAPEGAPEPTPEIVQGGEHDSTTAWLTPAEVGQNYHRTRTWLHDRTSAGRVRSKKAPGLNNAQLYAESDVAAMVDEERSEEGASGVVKQANELSNQAGKQMGEMWRVYIDASKQLTHELQEALARAHKYIIQLEDSNLDLRRQTQRHANDDHLRQMDTAEREHHRKIQTDAIESLKKLALPIILKKLGLAGGAPPPATDDTSATPSPDRWGLSTEQKLQLTDAMLGWVQSLTDEESTQISAVLKGDERAGLLVALRDMIPKNEPAATNGAA